ncbi:hypothetical protein FRC03_002267 [Tulasnella sp. 419]|nr:hypothetical protein FRC03_002267 [Tulasnella sp. 419]
MRNVYYATALLGLGIQAAQAAFGVTSSGGYYTVDTGAANPFIFKVNQANCDITSLLFQGVEYQYSSQTSHINSGLGSATVSATTISSTYIKITCVSGTLTQYYIAKSGDSIIYMGTYITAQPSIGELRFIARLNKSLLSVGDPEAYSDLGTAGAVEGSDVFKASNGYTYSKFYSRYYFCCLSTKLKLTPYTSVRFIDDQVHYVTTSSGDVHVSMVMPGTAYETSSGGPFHRDINTDRNTGFHALYFYMNSGHAQIEARRTGFNGPYALYFSRSGIPDKSLDTSFFSSLGLSGYVAASGRGSVSGTAYNVASSYQRVVHWYNSAAQYWAYTNSNGAFTSPLMKPGTYTMTLYKDEFKVASQSVSVSAGSTTQSSIYSAEDTATPLWIIGEFDGQPQGFQNADLIEHMHPSDPRMSSWTAKTYTVGSSSLSTFPMAQIKSVNNPTTIKFTLSSAPGAATLKIATTLAFSNGRPQVIVNSWTGPAPAAPVNLDSRGFTRGTYHGNNELYTVSIPSGVLVSGSNTIQINCISGNADNGFLSANFIYDAVALYKV